MIEVALESELIICLGRKTKKELNDNWKMKLHEACACHKLFYLVPCLLFVSRFMQLDYPHKIFTDERDRYVLLMQALAEDSPGG